MTDQNPNDPNLNRPVNRPPVREEPGSNATPWIVGAVVALAVILGIFAMTNRTDKTSTAANSPNPPVATTTVAAPATVPPVTTGSAVPSAPAPTAPPAR